MAEKINEIVPEVVAQEPEAPVEIEGQEAAEGQDAAGTQAEQLANTLMEEKPDEQQKEPSPEEARRAALIAGIESLAEDGWTGDELQAFSQDPQSREDIDGGKTVRQAFRAYIKRQTAAESKPAASKKTSVPTLRQSATSAAKDETLVANMSDEEFDKFRAKAMALAQEGKRVRIR